MGWEDSRDKKSEDALLRSLRSQDYPARQKLCWRNRSPESFRSKSSNLECLFQRDSIQFHLIRREVSRDRKNVDAGQLSDGLIDNLESSVSLW